MFQRIRGAINQTIAEEQARQKALSEPATPGGSNSGASQTSERKSKAKDDANADLTPNPDPAVFEAAFVIDDSEEPSRAGTPKPATDASAEDAQGANLRKIGDTGDRPADIEVKKDNATNVGTKQEAPETEVALKSATAELPPEIRQRLRKLDKLEATYPELLRSYRVAHRRATAIEPFEKALRENTPLTSISDPGSLIEYLTQLNLKGDMVMDELKRVSAEKDELKRKHEKSEDQVQQLESELAALKARGTAGDTTEVKSPQDSVVEGVPQTVKSPVASVIGMFSPKQKPTQKTSDDSEDFFSYDDEIPQLQAELAAKAEEIETVRGEVDSLKKELVTAKENSDKLSASLEKVTQDQNKPSDTLIAQEDISAQLQAKTDEINSLTERLQSNQEQLEELEAKLKGEATAHSLKIKDVEASLAASDKRASELDAELTKSINAKNISKKLIDGLNTHITTLKKEKEESLGKIAELTKKVETQPAPRLTTAKPAITQPSAPSGGGASAASKKKNKKKKGKGGATGPMPAAASQKEDEHAQTEVASESLDTSDLEKEIEDLKAAVSEKDVQIDRLHAKRKVEEDLQEEIDSLREDLVNIGQDHVIAKEKIKDLETEKAELKAEIAGLEMKLSSSATDTRENTKLQSEMDKMQKDYDELKEKTSSWKSDLGAAEQLAQQRYKDLTELKAVLQKAQPELKSLRLESAQLKTTKEELSATAKQLQEFEKKEAELKREIGKAEQLAASRETEIKGLKEKLTTETNGKLRLEDAQRTSGRNLRRAEAEKGEAVTRAEEVERELQKVQEEVNKLRPRVKELDEQVQKLKREKTASQEEVEFKSQQYTNAQGLLSSMRDQTTEMSVQLKEAKSQAEALEEELAEAQRLLQERTREGETMRRLLADVDERADNKIREMRGRMETAIEERDRIEDESSTLARRKARELEDFKSKVRELEREVKTLTHERDELDQREKEWRRMREELESVESKAEAEASEMQTAVSQLRTALDASEKQVQDTENQRIELRKLLDELQQKHERIQKELKTAQSKLVASSSRSSLDSNRSGLATNGSQAGGGSTGDTMYLKTILLQFLEQKDSRLRAQLVPVLGKLLKFDKHDEQKWQKAVQHIEVK